MKVNINGTEVEIPDVEMYDGVVILKMSGSERQHYLAHGCDPACHACFALIPEGDDYGYVEVLSQEEATRRGIGSDGVNGMFCGACVRAKKQLPPDEFEHMLGRVGARRDTPAAPDPAPMPKGRGCFMVDGRIIGGGA